MAGIPLSATSHARPSSSKATRAYVRLGFLSRREVTFEQRRNFRNEVKVAHAEVVRGGNLEQIKGVVALEAAAEESGNKEFYDAIRASRIEQRRDRALTCVP